MFAALQPVKEVFNDYWKSRDSKNLSNQLNITVQVIVFVFEVGSF
jgi:hypothetical protein